MDELDDIRRLHALDTKRGWSSAHAPLSGNASVERADVEALLATHAPHVPRTRTLRVVAAPLYDGKIKSEPRIALFDRVEVNKAYSIDAKKLARLLADPHASSIDAFRLDDAKSAAVLLEGLSGSTLGRITSLELNSAPTPDVLKGLLAHPKLASLENLDIGGDARALGDERLGIVVGSPVVTSLRRIALYGLDKITEASWKRLAAAPFVQLRSASFGVGTWIPRGTVRHALFGASWLGGLRVLSLNEVDEAELALVRERVPFAALTALSLQFRTGKTPARADLGDDVIPHLRKCQALALTHTTPAAVPALVASGILPELESLLITASRDPALAAAGLATATNPGDLTRSRHEAEAGFVWRYF